MSWEEGGPPVVAVVGRSGTGKTTLIEKLVQELSRRGHRIGTVKHHAHPGFDYDKPGKDSYRHKDAGSVASVLSAPDKLGMVRTVEEEWGLEEIAERLMPDVDLVLAEGYSSSGLPRIVITREVEGDVDVEETFGDGEVVAALHCGDGVEGFEGCPKLSRDDVTIISDLLEERIV